MLARQANSAELVAVLDAIFATRTRDEWGTIFDQHGVWWAPLQATHEVVDDIQAEGAGAFVDVPAADGFIRMVATPVDFGSTPIEARSMPPETGQHTEQILLELGYTWDEIIALKDDGAIP